MKIYDVTKPLPSCEVYPGDPAPRIRSVRTIEADGYRLCELFFGSHSGTHIDAPSHFLPNGHTVSDIILQKCMGNCVVCTNIVQIEDALAKHEKRIVLKGVDVDLRLAETLSDMIDLLGTDGMSVGGADVSAAHTALLKNDVVILENLDLTDIDAGEYRLIALPLKLDGADGSPVRAVLVRDEA